MIERLLFFIAGLALGSLLAKVLTNRPEQCASEYEPTFLEREVAKHMDPKELRVSGFKHVPDDVVFVVAREQQPS